jgi:acyl-CoA hydrolase
VVNAGVPGDTSAGALARLPALLRQHSPQLLLVGVPEASLLGALARSLSDHRMYEEVSTELKLPLHAGGWAAVLGDPALRSDPIHANARGYAQFARGLAQTARDVGLWAPR